MLAITDKELVYCLQYLLDLDLINRKILTDFSLLFFKQVCNDNTIPPENELQKEKGKIHEHEDCSICTLDDPILLKSKEFYKTVRLQMCKNFQK